MSEQIPSPTTGSGLGRKIVMFPLIRALIGIAFVIITITVISLIFRPLGHKLFPGDERPIAWVSFMWIFSGAMVALAYKAFVRFVERRPLTEFQGKNAPVELATGYGIGVALMSVSICIIWILGYYRVEGINGVSVLIVPFCMSIFTGIFEEILFRGIIFRIINESLGSWIAVIASALIFGFAHAMNPNATVFSSAAIALEAGVLLSAVYLITNRLWTVIAMHAAWNFVQGAIFGFNVSGTTSKGLLEAKVNGPALLTGGAFGAETSLITISFCTAVGIAFLYLACSKGNFRKPFWSREPETGTSDDLPTAMDSGVESELPAS